MEGLACDRTNIIALGILIHKIGDFIKSLQYVVQAYIAPIIPVVSIFFSIIPIV